MKKILIFIFCLWNTCLGLYSQNYLAEYYSKTKELNGTLLFSASTWRFDAVADRGIRTESNDIELDEDVSSSNYAIPQFSFRSLDKNYYLDEEFRGFSSRKCIIKGELEKPNWTIVADSTKKIDDYTCLLAKGFLCGRNFTAWFTPDIPVSAGPWKLWGLPGLIISARSDDDIVDISMKSLKKTDAFPTEPIVKETVNKEEYKILFQKELQKFKRSIRALSEGSMEIEVSAVDTKRIPDKSLLE
jgi:GLPGLI family protein